MAKVVNLTSERKQILFGKDNVIIQKHIADLPSGRVLDTEGITEEVLYAGHPIITDGNGNYKPLAVNTVEGVKSYGSLPQGWNYAGILEHSMLTSKPSAAILISGVVNDAAVEIPYGAHKAAIKSAIPTIMFVKDEVVDPANPAEESESASES